MSITKTHARFQTFDVVRGTAMLLVFISHFCQVYTVELSAGPASYAWWGIMVGRIATPTFMLTSGLVVGYLYQSRRADWNRLRLHLMDKAIFLGTVGHLVIAIFESVRLGSLREAFFEASITDTIAISVLVGVNTVSRITPIFRLALAGVLYATAWTAWSYWNPTVPSLLFLKAVFIGPQDQNAIWVWFPLLPWVSLYLGGSFLGAYVGSRNVEEIHTTVAVNLIKIAAGALILAVSARAVFEYMKYRSHSDLPAVWQTSISIYQKYPPAPVYLLFFGGIGLMVIGLWSRFGRDWKAWGIVPELAGIGQSSLIAFLVQYLLNSTILVILIRKNLMFNGLWPVYFLASTAVFLALMKMSRWAGLNGFCTVGLPALYQRWLRMTSQCQPRSIV